MATSLLSTPKLVDFIVTEARGQRSRDNVLVKASGSAIASGTLMKYGTSGDANKWIPYDDSGTVAGILYQAVPAGATDTKAVGFTSDCEVRRGALTGLGANGEAGLRLLGIKVRGKAGLANISTPTLT